MINMPPEQNISHIPSPKFPIRLVFSPSPPSITNISIPCESSMSNDKISSVVNDSKSETIHPLSSSWNLYCHSTSLKNNWEIDSFVKIYTFSTIEEFWNMYNNLNFAHILNYSDFFLMRNDIVPRWEDSKNINGGAWSNRFKFREGLDAIQEVILSLIGETFFSSSTDTFETNVEHCQKINGMSFCLKNTLISVKIWICCCDPQYTTDTSSLIDKTLQHFKIPGAMFIKFRPEYVKYATNKSVKKTIATVKSLSAHNLHSPKRQTFRSNSANVNNNPQHFGKKIIIITKIS